MSGLEATADEKRAIKALKRVAKNWPKTLWLFSAGGTLCVMRLGGNGEQVMLSTNGVDSAYVLDTIDIHNDGGDW